MPEIRPATRDDLAGLNAVYRAASLHWPDHRSELLSHPDSLTLDAGHLLAGGTLVAETNGRIVGFATSRVSTTGGLELDDLFVDPTSMGRGVGRSLVDEIVVSARSRGSQRLDVTANDNALGFYERLGFVIVGSTDTQFGRAPRMSLDLSALT